MDVRTIAEAALLMDLTVLLALLRILLPIPGFQGLVGLACPLPFVVLTLRRGSRVGLVAMAASYVLLSCFVGPVLATTVLVFGGLGVLFTWASRRHMSRVLTIVMGAALYGGLYLTPPFLFGLFVLRIDLGKTLHDVQKQAGSFLNGLGHLHILSVPVGDPVVSFLSHVPLGQGLLNLLHDIALALLTHPLITLIVFFALYSLVRIWAYFVVSAELFRLLPVEARRDVKGQPLDFFSIR